MLDYGSEDIDGMDDDAGEEEAQNPPLTGRWIHPKRIAAMTRATQSRINLLRYNQSADDSGAALSHAVKKTAIPAQEKIIL